MLWKMDAMECMCRMRLTRGLLMQPSVPMYFVRGGQTEPWDKQILKQEPQFSSHLTCQW